MAIKYKKHVTYEIERYPDKCNECPAFKQRPYSCHSDRGMEAGCELGYMNGKDMRDFSGNTKFKECWMGIDRRVTLMKK